MRIQKHSGKESNELFYSNSILVILLCILKYNYQNNIIKRHLYYEKKTSLPLKQNQKRK